MKTPTLIQRLQIAANEDFNETADGLNAALRAACLKGNQETVMLLIRAGADVETKTIKGSTLLMIASQAGHETIVEKLLADDRIEINAKNNNGATALMWASLYGHETISEKLIQAGADLSATNNKGETALSGACAKGHETIVEKLLADDRIEINAKNNKGYTALAIASYRGHETIVEQLLNAGADVNLKGKHGINALMLASCQGHRSIVKKLIKAGATIDDIIWSNVEIYSGHTACRGHTALMMAVSRRHEGIVEELITAGADVNAKNNEGCTALSIAEKYDGYGIVCKLKAATESISKTKRDQDEEAVGTEKSEKNPKKSDISSHSSEDSDNAPANTLLFFASHHRPASSQDESPTVQPVFSP